jgi:hypothetical protein
MEAYIDESLELKAGPIKTEIQEAEIVMEPEVQTEMDESILK